MARPVWARVVNRAEAGPRVQREQLDGADFAAGAPRLELIQDAKDIETTDCVGSEVYGSTDGAGFLSELEDGDIEVGGGYG